MNVSGKIEGPSMLSERMPPDNKTARQQRELSRLKNMLEDWEAGAKPLIDAWRNCLVLAALIPALLAMDGNAWFLLITIVILVIAIAIPHSPPWPECIDRALQNYQPSDAVAFRRLQDAVIVSGEITPDLLKTWLKDELLAVNGPMKKTQYTFTSRTIEDE